MTSRSQEALGDILKIAGDVGPTEVRLNRAKVRLRQFEEEAEAYYKALGDDDEERRVENEKARMRELIDERRVRASRQVSEVLEPLSDYANDEW